MVVGTEEENDHGEKDGAPYKDFLFVLLFCPTAKIFEKVLTHAGRANEREVHRNFFLPPWCCCDWRTTCALSLGPSSVIANPHSLPPKGGHSQRPHVHEPLRTYVPNPLMRLTPRQLG